MMRRYQSKILATLAIVLLGGLYSFAYGTTDHQLKADTTNTGIRSTQKNIQPAQIGNRYDDIRPTPEEILSEKGIPLTFSHLIAALKNEGEEEATRFWAAVALGRMGNRSAVPALIETLESVSSRLRTGAALALGELRDPSALPNLRKALQDSSEGVRSTAVQTISQIGGDEAVSALGEKLTDPNEPSVNIRANAAFLLGKLKLPSAEPWLIAALNDKSLDVRVYSAVALAELGNQVALPILMNTLEMPEARESLVAKSVNGLKKLTGKDFGYTKKYFAPVTKEEKNKAKRRWKEWWKNQ